MATNVSVVIPNWNGKRYLRDCLSSLAKQTLKPHETILVDNGSLDDSINYVQRKFPYVKIISLHKNYGFAKAINFGINTSKGNFVLILNNDTRFNKNFLKNLVKPFFINKPVKNLCAVTPKVIKDNPPYLLESAGDYMNVLGQAFHRENNEQPLNYYKHRGEKVFLCPATALLIKKKVFKKIGLFDETMFAYGEDVDWSFRAQLLGYKLWYEPKAKIFHKGSATGEKLAARLKFLQYKNYLYFVLKCFPGKLLLKNARIILILLVHINTFGYLCLKGFVKEALQANLWLFKNFRGIIQKRKKIQKNLKVNLNYIESKLKRKKIRLLKNK